MRHAAQEITENIGEYQKFLEDLNKIGAISLFTVGWVFSLQIMSGIPAMTQAFDISSITESPATTLHQA